MRPERHAISHTCGVSIAPRSIRVIASAAKQSTSAQRKNGLLRCARNDVQDGTLHTVVIHRECGVSSTPRLIGSIIAVSGILGHPPSRVTTPECAFAFSRRIAPELCEVLSLKTEGTGNAGCLLHPRSRVQCVLEMRTRAYRYSRARRHSLRKGEYGDTKCRHINALRLMYPPLCPDERSHKRAESPYSYGAHSSY